MKYQSPPNTKHKAITAPVANTTVKLTRADIEPYLPLFSGDERQATRQAAYDKEWTRIARDHDILPGDDVQDQVIWEEHMRHVIGMPGVKDPIDYDPRAKKEFAQAAMAIHKNGVIIEEEAPLPTPTLGAPSEGMGTTPQFTAPSAPLGNQEQPMNPM